jgi:hypothetical protein
LASKRKYVFLWSQLLANLSQCTVSPRFLNYLVTNRARTWYLWGLRTRKRWVSKATLKRSSPGSRWFHLSPTYP